MPYNVTVHKSAQALSDATGLVVTPGLDDSTTDNVVAGDVLTTYGGTYTLIQAVPVGTTILQKGGFYITIILS